MGECSEMIEKCDCDERDAMFGLAVTDSDGKVIDEIRLCGDCILATLPDEFSASTNDRLTKNR